MTVELQSGRYLGNNRKSISLEGIQFSITEYLSKVYEGWHQHENDHLSMVLRGGSLEHRRSCTLDSMPGRVIFYKGQELHKNTDAVHPTLSINVEIKKEFVQRYQLSSIEAGPLNLDSPAAKFAILKISKEVENKCNTSVSSIHLLLLQLLNSHKPISSSRPQWIEQLTDLLHDRWNETLSLEEMASVLQVHPVTISRYFPRYFTCTLGDYVRDIRINKAIHLVTNTDQSLTEIAIACGFYDQSHFIRNFKQKTNFLPNELRKV